MSDFEASARPPVALDSILRGFVHLVAERRDFAATGGEDRSHVERRSPMQPEAQRNVGGGDVATLRQCHRARCAARGHW